MCTQTVINMLMHESYQKQKISIFRNLIEQNFDAFRNFEILHL